jgi:hypothetical protein
LVRERGERERQPQLPITINRVQDDWTCHFLASSGDSIMVAAATYKENLTINISLNVIGAGAKTTVIDGQGTGRVINIYNFRPVVTVSNLTLRNGFSSSGAGIYNSGWLTINNSTISGNTSSPPNRYNDGSAGAGIYNYSVPYEITAKVWINNTTISGNTAACHGIGFPPHCSSYGGGIFNNCGELFVTNSTIAGNNAQALGPGGQSQGGGIYNYFETCPSYDDDLIQIIGSTISGNSASLGGGIIGAWLQNSIIAGNSGGNCGRAVGSNGYNMSSDGTCNFSNSSDRNNADPMLGPLQYNGGPTQTMALSHLAAQRLMLATRVAAPMAMATC